VKETTEIYDFIGIGIGPFNLGLACLAQPIEELNCLFLDKTTSFNWHPGMLLEQTTLQIPFMADLVTFADPTSPFSFLNYLKETGKFYSFYIRENFLVLRNEYNQYCQWVIRQLNNLHFGIDVKSVQYDAIQECYVINAIAINDETPRTYHCRKLVIGVGTLPDWPACCEPFRKELIHSSSYLFNKQTLQLKKSITIVGSGQSAAEIFYDLLQEIEFYDYELNWYTRSPQYYPMDFTKFTGEMTSPEYVNYFYSLQKHQKENILKKQGPLFKGINIQLISKIYDLMYTKRLLFNNEFGMQANADLEEITYNNNSKEYILKFFQHEKETHFERISESVIIASGYTTHVPAFLKNIKERICFDKNGNYATHKNYTIDKSADEIFVQNAESHTHGFTSYGLDIACYRNSIILNEILGKTHYHIHHKNIFQQFMGNIQETRLAVHE
jgi:lysine N6-hydroxylase